MRWEQQLCLLKIRYSGYPCQFRLCKATVFPRFLQGAYGRIDRFLNNPVSDCGELVKIGLMQRVVQCDNLFYVKTVVIDEAG